MRKLNIFLSCFLFSTTLLFAQFEKGIKPAVNGQQLIVNGQQSIVNGQQSIVNNQKSIVNNTYAVVVGISDYQDPGIPDLRFADKDAEAFANYLSSDAGGKLDVDHLKVLLNEKATVAQFAIALDWLMEVVKENDQVIIYFSGHGDVEKKTITQPGYLLCWDAPARVYLAGGALALPMFQDIITTLSAQNKAKVIVVTDACRSGKLAGSSVGGSQITGANLAKQYSNEIKILSCQPNEYSIEGEQWGGGRGAFSYNLVNALYGFADHNNDLKVTLQEVGRYLDDHVPTEVAPVSQLPIVLGNRNEIIATVDNKVYAAMKSGNAKQLAMLSAIDSRGIEEEVLALVDTSTRVTYQLFKQVLKDKIFLEPMYACAETYYTHLMQEPKLQRLHSTITRNYAAALQDDAQQVLNKLLLSDPSIYSLSPISQSNKYKKYPAYLDRSAELLGEGHYLNTTLKARMYFFKGYLLQLSNTNLDKNKAYQSIAYFKQAIKIQADFPLPYWQLCNVYGRIFNELDSAKYYAESAMILQPNWLLPYMLMSNILSNTFQQFDKADQYLNLANQIDSNSAIILNGRGVYYLGQKNLAKAEMYYKKAILKAPLFVYPYRNLGDIYVQSKRFKEAEELFNIVMQLDSTNDYATSQLAYLYLKTKQFSKSEAFYFKALKFDSSAVNFCNVGFFYAKVNKFEQAEHYLNIAIKLDPNLAVAFTNLGFIQKETKRYLKAEQNLKMAISLDPKLDQAYLNLGWVQKETQRHSEAEINFKKALELNANSDNYSGLGALYLGAQRYDEAEKVFLKALELDSLHQRTCNDLGFIYYIKNQYKESELFFQKAYKNDPTDNYTLSSLACLYGHLQQVDVAYTYLILALENGWNNIEQLEGDTDLISLRNQKERWKALMKKYFAEKLKD